MTASDSGNNHAPFFGAASRNHPDFQLPWVQKILTNPDVKIIDETPQKRESETISKSMFNVTLAHSAGIKARILLLRPCPEPDALSGQEYLFILSIGDGLDGKSGRAHGGLSSLLLDHITGVASFEEYPAVVPPATAFLNVQYKNPILTPVVFLARAWVTETSGRKVFVKGVLEDGSGKVLATGKALFIQARTESRASL